MYCAHCHYGSQIATFNKCPMCSCTSFEDSNPFPKHPTGMGKGGGVQKRKETKKGGVLIDEGKQLPTTAEEIEEITKDRAAKLARCKELADEVIL